MKKITVSVKGRNVNKWVARRYPKTVAMSVAKYFRKTGRVVRIGGKLLK